MSSPQVSRFSSAADLVTAAAARFTEMVVAAQTTKGTAVVSLTGGSNGVALLEALRDGDQINWGAVDIYFGDDRFVPEGNPDRNYQQARDALLDHVPVDPARVFPMAPSDGPHGDDIAAAAADYAALLAARAPVFDVYLLGMGGEGHINSLFPDSAAVLETDLTVVAVTDSPKPPPARITMTLPVFAHAERVWFLVAGADKAEAVAAAVNGANPVDWPAAGAVGTLETVWFVDAAAASDLG